MDGAWRILADGVTVSVKVQPKSRNPGLQGMAASVDGPRLRIGVREPAENGRANRAACAALAEALGVPAASVAVTVGATSRQKTLQVIGNPATLAARLTAL
jgi:uncharacterized protein (TIGR00251 family)